MPRARALWLQSAHDRDGIVTIGAVLADGGAGHGRRVELRALFAPGRCLSCRAPGPPACHACRAALRLLTGPTLRPLRAADGAAPPNSAASAAAGASQFTSARAAVALEGPAHALVRTWKDRGLRGAADVAAELVAAVVAPPVPGVVLLVPVPALAARAAWRGGDGARALAERLAEAWSAR